jgi:hypothetical protein
MSTQYSRERLPAAAAQPAKVRQSCSATDYYIIIIIIIIDTTLPPNKLKPWTRAGISEDKSGYKRKTANGKGLFSV